MSEKKLTELQQFALDQLKQEGGDLTANQLAHRWARHKRGDAPVSSRRMFGYTAAGYRCLRDLAKEGKLIDNGRHFHLKHN
jgi:hypothetical protein